MQIGQVIEQILEDEANQFIGVLSGCEYLLHVVCGKIKVRQRHIRTGDTYNFDELPYLWVLKSIEWELVRQPVSFMEACNSENMFEVDHDLTGSSGEMCRFSLSSFVLYLHHKKYSATEIREILRDGEFFIVDESECDYYQCVGL